MAAEKLDTKVDPANEMINLGNDRLGRPIVVRKKWLDDFRTDWDNETMRGFEDLLATKK